MTLDQLIVQLSDAKKSYGGDIRVYINQYLENTDDEDPYLTLMGDGKEPLRLVLF
jgi:hypothetical protein